MIKFILICLLSWPLFAGVINLNFSNKQLINGSWTLTFPKGKTSMLMLPIDVNFKDIQASLTNNEILYIYTNEQTPNLLKVKFGVYFVGLVKITKNSIIYAVVDDEGKHIFNNFKKLSEYLKNNISNNITNDSKKNIFLNSYIPYLEKIKANGLYKILPQNNNFTFKINLPINNLNNGFTPPSPPKIPNPSTLNE